MPSKNSDKKSDVAASQIELDLYFLIARFLSLGPCQKAGRILIKELERYGLLHKSLDWTGNEQQSAFQHSLSRFRDISPTHLLQICQKMGPLLNDVLPPPIPGEPSLCGLGRHSLLRTRNSVQWTSWGSRSYSACIARKPLVPPQNLTPCHNWTYGIFGRETGGSKFRNILRPPKTLYGRMKLHRRILGHLSSVYCLLFDRTGARIFTGSDDCLIKCWSASQGRLLGTFRGHQSEICDMDISYENTILASASCAKEIRIWDTRNGRPISILQSHSAMITSIQFSAIVQGDTRYLISTGRDGNVCFWIWNAKTLEFGARPYKFEERNRPGVAMLCSSCSSGGRFVAVGGSDNLVHIYHIPFEHNTTAIGPLTIAEQDEHTDTVDSIWFAHDGIRLISGSKDGTARIWTFEYSTWSSAVLDVTRTTESVVQSPSDAQNYNTRSKMQGKDNTNKLYVIMVAWDCCDENVITSLNDFMIKVWNSRTRHLVSALKGHTDETYCLEPHPTDKRILLTAGHDGNVFLWNVVSGSMLMNFHNMLEGLGHGAVFDAKFSQNGDFFACTDSHGHLLIFGYGDEKTYLKCPMQQFFHTDYRPLIRDQNGYVLDEQTQQAPHLMPPPFLVDVDGNPYPPDLQRLVPGRERSNDSQLFPNLVVQENNAFHVIDVENIPEETPQEQSPLPRSALDNRIQAMLHDGEDELEMVEDPPPFASPNSAVGLRREGDTAGVRQMHRNAPRSQVASVADIMALTQRVLTPQFSLEESRRKEYIHKKKGHFELLWYRRERKKRRPVSHRRLSKEATKQAPKEQESHRNQRKLRSTTYFKEDPEEEERDYDQKKRWIHKIRRNGHRYSTRSSAPRRRMSSVAESNHGDGFGLSEIALEEEDEHCSSRSDGTSSYSSSEEDFSRKAKIVRRSKRKNITNGHIRHRNKKRDNLNAEGQGLRRSMRQRKAPKRLENSSNRNSSATTTSDGEEEVPGSGSLFASPIVAHGLKRRQQKKIRKARAQRITSNISNNCNSSGDEHDTGNVSDNQPSTSAKCQNAIVQVQLNGETTSENNKNSAKIIDRNVKVPSHLPFNITPGEPPPENFLPPEWIKRITPCTFPYMPQIEDEVVYLRQGHQLYISKVLAEHAWTVDESELCYKTLSEINVVERCRVTRIEYRIGPPTLCEVILRPINRKISKKSTDFSVKYHDMPNVDDFLILKDKYDLSVSRQWSDTDIFRSVIDDTWWYGTIVEKRPHSPAFPESYFKCFAIVWDSDNGQGDVDYLSPWDMEPIPESISKSVITRSQNQANTSTTSMNHTQIDPKEMCHVISYKFKRSDWTAHDESDSDEENVNPENSMIHECQRIADGLQKLINSGEFVAFASPVDVTRYPQYPLWVAYPTDLSTMLLRVKNLFYRRSSALCWEFAQLEKNAIAFNEPNSIIAKNANDLRKLLEKFVKTKSCTDILDLQHDAASSSASEDEEAIMSEVDSRSRPVQSSEGGEESDDVRKSDRDSRDISEYATTAGEDEGETHPAWVEEAKTFLRDVIALKDSRPFRERPQRDEEEEEDDDSLDLCRIENKLENRLYKTPEELKSDIELMFSSFKNTELSREGKTMYARLLPHMRSRIVAIVSKWMKSQSEKESARSLRLARRRARIASDSIFQPLSKPNSQDSDWAIEAGTRSKSQQSGMTIGAYTTRQRRAMAKECSEPAGDRLTSITRNSTQEKPEARIGRMKNESGKEEKQEELPSSSGLELIEGEGVRVHVLDSSVKDESYCKVTVKHSKRHRLSNSDVEIGQGDACLNSRNRKKPKLTALSCDSSSDDNESDDSFHDFEEKSYSKSNGYVRKYARPPTFSKVKHNHQLRDNRHKPVRFGDYSDLDENQSEEDDDVECSKMPHKNILQQKSSQADRTCDETKKHMTFNEEDSDSDYGDIVETDDLECEFPALSPEGHPMPKKSKRFRDSNRETQMPYKNIPQRTSSRADKIGETKKRMTFNQEDSHSDYGDIVETNDLECEFLALSPEGHPMPKKSKRFRDLNRETQMPHKNIPQQKSSHAYRIGETKKRMTFNEEDSDSDYGGIVETDDLECEFPPLSPEGQPMSKKNKRFRDSNSWGMDSFTRHATEAAVEKETILVKKESPGQNFLEDSDDR